MTRPPSAPSTSRPPLSRRSPHPPDHHRHSGARMSSPKITASGAPAAFAEPQRAVTGAWIAAFAAAWLGVWMAQLGPFQVLVPLQVAAATGSDDTTVEGWIPAVLAFGAISGIAG